MDNCCHDHGVDSNPYWSVYKWRSMTGSTGWQSNIGDLLNMAKSLFPSYYMPLVIICGMLFFVLIVGIIMRSVGKGEAAEDFFPPEDDIFTDEI